jgi:flagellar protein FliO/FliZ
MRFLPAQIAILLCGLCGPLVQAGEEKPATASVLSDSNVTAGLLQTTLGLLLVLALIIGIAWLVKRFGQVQSGVQGKLKVVGGVSLGTRERVVLLQVGEQQLVLGVAPGQIRTLHVLEKPLPMAEEKQALASSFAARLQAAMKGKGRQ